MPDINCQYLLAVAMLDGELTFASAHDFERMQDPNVLAMKQRVHLAGDPELTKVFPKVRPARVEIETLDGRQFEIRIDRVPGAPDAPLSWEQAEGRFLALSQPVLGESRAQTLANQVQDLDSLDDVGELGACIRPESAR
jgi:2-methylcitrate dehydratase PrpD